MNYATEGHAENPRAREIGQHVYDYDSALEFLGGKLSRKLANNTVVHTDASGGPIHVRLHRTNVVTYLPSGNIILDSGQYSTKTTAQRIRELLPAGYRLERWTVIAPDGTKQKFFDGMILRTRPSQYAIAKARGLSSRMTPPDYPGHMPNPRGKYTRWKPGDRFEVSVGAGLRSGETGKVVGRDDIPSSLWREYPHVGGGPRKGWVAVIWDKDGEPDTFPTAYMRPERRTSNPRQSEMWVDVWEERDRAIVTLYRGVINDPNASIVVASWVDDEVREMVEGGFFKSGRNFKSSVLKYAEDVGLV